MECKTTKPIISNIINDLQRLEVKALTFDSVDEIIERLNTIIETLREVEKLVHNINYMRNITKQLQKAENELDGYLIMDESFNLIENDR